MATILIEEQEIPSDLVRSTITSYADQRIEIIKQQVMSRATLLKVVEQYDLYADLRAHNPAEEVLKQFAKDIVVEVMSADVIDKRTHNATKATIAFTVAYHNRSPEVAQTVANELTSLFLGENLKSRERQAQETTAFLKQEAEDLGRHIEAVEGKLSTFKQRARGALPELMSLNLQLMNQTDRELTDMDQQIRSLEERKSYLDGELATLKPNTPIIASNGDRILESGELLRVLRAEYATKAASLSLEHPDVIKMQQEIAALEKDAGGQATVEDVVKRLTGERTHLASLRDKYSGDHPDVMASHGIIASLENELRRAEQKSVIAPLVKPENPAYINIQAQRNSVMASLESLREARTDLKRRHQDYAKRIERTPEIEPDYLALARERDTLAQKYQDIRSRLMEAKVSEGLEVQRKGERFSLIDPPSLPEKPDKPHRLAIALLGCMLAFSGGIASGLVADNLDTSIHSPESLAQITHAYPLAVIPYIPNNADLRRLIAKRRTVRLAGIGIAAACILFAHFFWLPLDVVWFAALRKFGLD